MAFYLGPYLVSEVEVNREDWRFDKLAWMRETSNPEELLALPEDFDLPPEEVQSGACLWTLNTFDPTDGFYIDPVPTDPDGFYLLDPITEDGFYLLEPSAEGGFYLLTVPDPGGFYLLTDFCREGFYLLTVDTTTEEFYINVPPSDEEGFYLLTPLTAGGFYLLVIED